MEKQVDKNAYNFNKYCAQDRWASYWHQIKEILSFQPSSVLEIGVGDKILLNYLKNNTSIEYTSMDIAPDLKPDIIGSVDDMKNIKDNSYDMVCAFEVLEHLSFDKLNRALFELKRVARKQVIISLPHWGRHFSIKIRLPYFKIIKWQIKFSFFPIKHVFDGQHYWEIGKAGYGLNSVKNIILKSGFKIKKDYIAFEFPYHHFFVLEK